MPVDDSPSSPRQEHHDDALGRSSSQWAISTPPSSASASNPDQAARPESAVSIAPDDKTVISKRPAPAEAHAPGLLNPLSMGQSLVGMRLEHYELCEFVGGGGMGAVFRANDTRLSRTVAVKILLRDRTDDETIRRFRNEAQNAARLDHPHIARVYYVGEDHGWNFIVFEFIAGENLRNVVDRDGPLKIEDALTYTLQIAEAVAHASSRDVVHRDIKPSNVLLMSGNVVKLVDMGLARLHQVASEADELTASGVTLGTFDYISPEQARDPRAADVRSDIYSLGCTLYLMLAGQPPFPDGTALQKLIRHSSDEPTDVRAFRPEIPASLAAVLAKMLAKRPSQRHQTAAELIADLAGVARQLGLNHILPTSATLPAPVAVSGNWTKLWQAAGAVATLVFVVLALDWLAPSRSDTLAARRTPRFVQALPESAAEPSGDAALPSPTAQLPPAAEKPAAKSAVSAALANSSSNGTSSNTASQPPLPTSLDPTPNPPPDRLAVTSSQSEIPPAASDTPSAEIASPPQISAIPATESAKPKRIIVLPTGTADANSDEQIATSLSEACHLATSLGLTEIELHWTGLLVSEPIEIANSRLTFKAAPGHRPLVAFSHSGGERQMIRLVGGPSARLSFQGVELQMQAPLDSADASSLISLSAGQSLELLDSILTVEGPIATSRTVPQQLSMISVQARRPGDTMMATDPQPMMSQSATVVLERCIVRGEATLLVMPDETPLTLRWHQGLLATSRRLLETGGCTGDPKFYEKIVLDLKHVTASCPRGLHQMTRGPGKGFQLTLDVNAEHCILTTGPSTPLFTFAGLPAIDEEDLRFQCNGDYNCYPDADVALLRVIPSSAGDRPQDFELDDRRWSVESHPQVGNPWLHAPRTDRPSHALTKDDFLADANLTAGAGFDPLLLPDAADEDAQP